MILAYEEIPLNLTLAYGESDPNLVIDLVPSIVSATVPPISIVFLAPLQQIWTEGMLLQLIQYDSSIFDSDGNYLAMLPSKQVLGANKDAFQGMLQ